LKFTPKEKFHSIHTHADPNILPYLKKKFNSLFFKLKSWCFQKYICHIPVGQKFREEIDLKEQAVLTPGLYLWGWLIWGLAQKWLVWSWSSPENFINISSFHHNIFKCFSRMDRHTGTCHLIHLQRGQNCYYLFDATFVLLIVFMKDKYFKYFRTNCDRKNLVHFFQIKLWSIVRKWISKNWVQMDNSSFWIWSSTLFNMSKRYWKIFLQRKFYFSFYRIFGLLWFIFLLFMIVSFVYINSSTQVPLLSRKQHLTQV